MGWPLLKILGGFYKWFLGDDPVPTRAGVSVGWGVDVEDDGANDRIILSNSAPVRSQILSGSITVTASAAGADAFATLFYFESEALKADAEQVRLYVLAALTSGTDPWHIVLGNETDSSIVVETNQAEDEGEPVEVDVDVTADLLGADKKFYSLQAYSDTGDPVLILQAYLVLT